MLRQVFSILAACVVASLVAVDHEAIWKPIDLANLCRHRHDKTKIDSFGHGSGDDFAYAEVLDGGKVASAIGSVVDVADVGRKVLSRF